MIKVIIGYKNNQFSYLRSSGHSGYAKHGQDIICAAVSGIIPGGFEALTDGDKNYEADVKDGFVELRSLATMSEHDLAVIDTIIAQIEGIARSYPDYVSLERKNDK